MWQSTKEFAGFSACFRQWRATHSHCKYLHGYALRFKVWFERTNSDLDHCNWVMDFGGLDAAKEKLAHWFDHTTVIARDDPFVDQFEELSQRGLIDLRLVSDVGAERFAKIAAQLVQDSIPSTVRVMQVECFEGTHNSGIWRYHE